MPLSDLKLSDFQLFIAVVESSSLAEAAERLETTSSKISRRLKKIEESLGARLLERTTRVQHITAAGESFYRQCQATLNQFDVVAGQIRDRQDSPEGLIRVYAPAELFSYLVRELTERFILRYPKLRVEFLSGAAKPHLLEDNIDVIIHIDEPEDSSSIARRITTATTSCYASPGYLASRGEPDSPADLHQHDCVVELNQQRVPRPWHFLRGETMTSPKLNYRFSSDSIVLCRDLIEQDLGISMLPDFIVRESVVNGRLKRLFPTESSSGHGIFAMYASRRYVPAKITTFIDFLADELPGRI